MEYCRQVLGWCIGLALAAVPSAAVAQLETPSTGGIVALEESLRPIGVDRRLLIIGAHPDDEDTELLTVAVRQFGAEAAYLSLNRGEGGQNLIGPELGEALGLIRTEELLAARRIDGAQQYFTRAYDFGYSKSLEDTWAHWPRDSILKDVVRIIRRFQPQVVVSVFSGTPRDGHGQHQAAGWATFQAFQVAGDSTVFPELLVEEGLRPWSPVKLYRSARFSPAAATLIIPGGDLDPVVGQSYHQIAMRSRSQHRSQDMGRPERMGPSEIRVALVEDRTGSDAGDDGLFFGVMVDFSGLVAADAADQAAADQLVARYLNRVGNAKAVPRPDSLAALADTLELALADLTSLMVMLSSGEGGIETLVPPALEDQRRHLAEAILVARGVVFDVYGDQPHSTPGAELTLRMLGWNGSANPAQVVMGLRQRVAMASPPPVGPGGPIEPGAVDTIMETIIPDRPAVDPYFLQAPRQGAMYQWIAPGGVPSRGLFSVYGLPFGPAPVRGMFTVMLEHGSITVDREAAYRYLDQASGEVRQPVMVLPRIDVVLEPANTVLPAGGDPHDFTVTLTNNGADTVGGEVELRVPSGWPRVNPQQFTLQPGGRAAYPFAVPVPQDITSGTFTLEAMARADDGGEYRLGVVTVSYPHIHVRTYSREAAARVSVAELVLPDMSLVGYIRGAADRVPEALVDLGLPVALIDDDTLARGDLTMYDAIVIGSRAYEVNEALIRYNDRLIDYAEGGGLLVVQYQQFQFFDGDFAPFDLSVGGRPLVEGGSTSRGARPGGRSHDRVADQTAVVRVLEPGNPALSQPNRITDADWDGWVQERGLYFARSWDTTYQPVVEMHDPGEGPLEGGILVADVGEGRYVYTGISFFRQLPAGVPGAYRLFMNLLALQKTKGVS